MAKQGTYYLARVSKMGMLTSELIVQALLRPTPVVMFGNAWSFVDAKEYETGGIKYVVGRLVKYRPDAEVIVVDPARRTDFVQQEPNLRIASSPFVYIPGQAGIAFLRVAGQIEEWHFTERFARIIEQTHLLTECELNLIADLKSFSAKLSSLSGIYRIATKIRPPNPCFSPIWKSLRDYIKMRRAGQVVLREDSKSKEPLNTNLPQLVARAAAQPDNEPFVPNEEVPIGDAAALMAADGYGTGHIKGVRDGAVVMIRTTDTNRNFSFDKDPIAEELFAATFDIFEIIWNERHMEH
mgnify:CR=1 FL=1